MNAEAFDERLAADAGAAMFDVAERIIKAMRAVAGTVAAQHLSYGDAVFAECMGEVDTPRASPTSVVSTPGAASEGAAWSALPARARTTYKTR